MRLLTLRPPLSGDLEQELQGARTVQFAAPLADSDYERLARILQHTPDVPIRAFGNFSDVSFLRYFPFVKHLALDIWSLTDISGLDAVEDLVTFAFGRTKKPFSLRMLERFPSLRGLHVERHHKDFDTVCGLTQLRGLSLRSMTLPNLDFLSAFPHLRHFELKLGGSKNLSGLSDLKNLRYVELWLIRGLTDAGVLGDLTSLEALFLQALKHVAALPSLRNLRSLRHLYLEQMKGLRDLHSVAEAPALEDLTVVDMPQLPVSAFSVFRGHPALKYFSAGLGSVRRNQEASALLSLPKPSQPVWREYSLYGAATGDDGATAS